MKKVFLLSLVCSIVFFSCKTSKNIQQDEVALKGNWILVKDGKDVVGCRADKPLNLMVTDKGVNGFSGCNRYFGPFKIAKKQHIKFGPLGSTMMACLEGDCAKVEVGFIKNIHAVNKYKLSNGLLSLYQDDTLLMTFRKDKAEQ